MIRPFKPAKGVTKFARDDILRARQGDGGDALPMRFATTALAAFSLSLILGLYRSQEADIGVYHILWPLVVR